MAQGTNSTNTFSEGLRKILSMVSDIKLADDADLPFLIQLETQIIGKLKGGVDQALGQGGQGQGMGDPSMGGGAGLMGTPAPPPGMGSPAGVPGLMQGPGAPNMDELRRSLGNATIASRLGNVAQRLSGA